MRIEIKNIKAVVYCRVARAEQLSTDSQEKNDEASENAALDLSEDEQSFKMEL